MTKKKKITIVTTMKYSISDVSDNQTISNLTNGDKPACTYNTSLRRYIRVCVNTEDSYTYKGESPRIRACSGK